MTTLTLNKDNYLNGAFDHIDKGELDHLKLDHLLEYTDALSLYAQSVSLGGTIEITATDFESIIDKYSRHIMYLDQVNNFLCGDRRFFVTIENVVKDITNLGFQVMVKRIDPETSEMYVQAERIR